MAWVEKRSSGYLVRWRDGQGRKRQRLLHEEAAALIFAQAMAKEPRRTSSPKAVTLADYIEATLRAADELRESTRYHYVSMARRHITPAIGHRLLAQATSDDVRELLARMREAGYSESYRSIARNVLARTFKLAVSEGLLLRSPLDAVPALEAGNATRGPAPRRAGG